MTPTKTWLDASKRRNMMTEPVGE